MSKKVDRADEYRNQKKARNREIQMLEATDQSTDELKGILRAFPKSILAEFAHDCAEGLRDQVSDIARKQVELLAFELAKGSSLFNSQIEQAKNSIIALMKTLLEESKLQVKVKTPDDEELIATITSVWPSAMAVAERISNASEPYPDASTEEDIRLTSLECFREVFYDKMQTFITECENEAFLKTLRILGFPKKAISKHRQLIVSEIQKVIRNRVSSPGRGGREGVNIDGLSENYHRVLEKWHGAEEIFLDCQKSQIPARREKWRGQIKEYFQDELPNDLVILLDPKIELPGKDHERWIEIGGEPTADCLALLHASMLCGIPKFKLKISTLKKYVRARNFNRPIEIPESE